ncbi:MAG: tetratricopeptide repeat protein, partial [Candidatus Hydrogenedentes bacterium]|nr:tetratricopeptide repeat protein [Candidatus Hydrogenedentota bacterium]
MINLRLLFLFAFSVVALVYGQDFGVSGIKANVEEAFRARQASADAFAQGNAEEGQSQAQRSASLFREARASYESMRADESVDVGVLVDYAGLLNEMEDYDLAENALLRAAAIAPGDAAVWLKLGQTQAALGPASESRAIRSLRRAADIEPSSQSTVEAHASLGALYQQAGLYEFAREAFNEALELDPDHIGSRLTIASLDAREGKMVEAEAAFDSIEALSPEHGGYIKRTLGPSLDEFAASRRWLPDTADAHFAYAKLLVRVDRIEDSVWPLLRS